MNSQKFNRREVERSFRKFKDIVNDLLSARFQTWDNMFSHMIMHCETDPVMRVVIAPLRNNTRVNLDEWYAKFLASKGGMVGSARYELPYDDEDRTALIYQFFLKIEREEVDISDFCMHAYGRTNFQEMVNVFNSEIVVKFARELSYRLDEIIEDIGDQREVPVEAMTVFQYHDHSVNIHGNVEGSNVAGSGAVISGSPGIYNTPEELSEGLKTLRSLVSEVVADQRTVVGQALDLMIQAVGDRAVPVEQVAEAAALVARQSPTLGQRLKDIAGRIGVSLTGSAIFQGIKIAIGIP